MRVATARLLCLLIAAPRVVAAQAPDPAELSTILKVHVAQGGVDYTGVKANRAGLDRYITQVGAVTAANYDTWNRNQQLAYLLNAYNAIVLQSVIDKYPIKRSLHPMALLRPGNSVWQIPGFFNETTHRVAGRQLTLDDIEHKLLRATFREPRIHVALVCAARSCPPLRGAAYMGDSIDVQLDDQARAFLNDRARNLVDHERGVIRLSEIFKWFSDDFGGSEKGVITFVSHYMSAPTQQWLRDGKYRITYFDYDWTLNDVPAR
jgi:hypothetical protein